MPNLCFWARSEIGWQYTHCKTIGGKYNFEQAWFMDRDSSLLGSELRPWTFSRYKTGLSGQNWSLSTGSKNSLTVHPLSACLPQMWVGPRVVYFHGFFQDRLQTTVLDKCSNRTCLKMYNFGYFQWQQIEWQSSRRGWRSRKGLQYPKNININITSTALYSTWENAESLE